MPLLPYVPSPQAYAADPVLVQAPLLRADVDGIIALITRPPVFEGFVFTAQQSVSTGTDLLITLDANRVDPYNSHSTSGATNSKCFPPLPGWYLARSAVALSPGSSGFVMAGIQYVTNGAASVNVGGGRVPMTVGTGSFPGQHPSCARLVQIVSGLPGRAGTDYIAAYIRQSSGGNLNTIIPGAVQETSRLHLHWAGTGTVSSLNPPSPQPAPQLPNPLTAAWLKHNITDAVNFLINPPIMEVQLNTAHAGFLPSAATVPDLSAVVVPLDTTIVDNYSAFGPGGGNNWVVPVGGVYWLWGQVDINLLTTSQNLAAGLTITSPLYNGGQTFTWWGGAMPTQAVSGEDNCATVCHQLRLNPGDTVSLGGYQRDSGANAVQVNGSAGAARCRLISVWKGI